MVMRYPAAVAIVAALVAAVPGCAQTPAPRLAPAPPSPYVRSTDSQFVERAAYIAQAWEGLNDPWRNGFVPRQSSTVEGPTGVGEYKASAYSGRYTLATMATLPVEAPPDGTIAFDNGDAMRVPLVTAVRAYEQLTVHKSDPCTACPTLTVTGAVLGTVKIETSRGPATVPAWLFTVSELSSPMGQLAVAPAELTSTPIITAPIGYGRLAAAGSLDVVVGLHVEFRAAVSNCDQTNPQPQVWETATVVVLGATVQPRDSAVACTAIGSGPNTPMSVTLSRPVGDRLVIDVLGGQPVPEGV
jgi:hypothetical protein